MIELVMKRACVHGFRFLVWYLRGGWCSRSHQSSYIWPSVQATMVHERSLEWYWTTEHMCFSDFPVDGVVCLCSVWAHLFYVNFCTYDCDSCCCIIDVKIWWIMNISKTGTMLPDTRLKFAVLARPEIWKVRTYFYVIYNIYLYYG